MNFNGIQEFKGEPTQNFLSLFKGGGGNFPASVLAYPLAAFSGPD